MGSRGLVKFFPGVLVFLLFGCGGNGGDLGSPLTGGQNETQTELIVSSTQPWQDSGVTVSPGQTVKVEYQRGMWTANPDRGFFNAGGDYILAKPLYSLPVTREASLVGRVGNRVFLIGLGATIPENLSGQLELVINDDLQAVYGPGLADNIGEITVQITVR